MLPISMFGNDTEPTQTVAGSITLINDEHKIFVAVPFDETGKIKLNDMYVYVKELWKDDPFYINALKELAADGVTPKSRDEHAA